MFLNPKNPFIGIAGDVLPLQAPYMAGFDFEFFLNVKVRWLLNRLFSLYIINNYYKQ